MPLEEAVDIFSQNFENKNFDADYMQELLEGVEEHITDIDKLLTQHLQNWKLSRLGKIDRNIMRLGVYELLHQDELPHKVALNEAIELGKKYGDAKTSAFINCVLDRIRRNHAKTQ